MVEGIVRTGTSRRSVTLYLRVVDYYSPSKERYVVKLPEIGIRTEASREDFAHEDVIAALKDTIRRHHITQDIEKWAKEHQILWHWTEEPDRWVILTAERLKYQKFVV